MELTDWAVSMPGAFPPAREWHAASRTMFAIRRGDLDAATKWGAQLEQHVKVDGISRRVKSRLLIAQDKKKEAMSILERSYTRAARVDAYGSMIMILVYQVLAAGSQEQALAFLSEALTLAEPRGFIRTFVDEGKLLKPLLERALSRGVTPNYTRNLLDIIKAEERQRLDRQGGAGTPAAVPAVLSGREMEVLRLVAAGLSNRRIAERLVVTPGTVKVHVYNIMEKLGAQSRTQAVARARELKLI